MCNHVLRMQGPTSGVNMRPRWLTRRGSRITLPEKRPINFRTSQLLARRHRLRRRLGISLAAFISLGSLFVAFE